MLVNTCAVTSEAERKARKLIRKLKKENPGAFLVATGCYAELLKSQENSSLPYDLLVPQKEKDGLVDEVMFKAGFSLKNFKGESRNEDFFASPKKTGRTRLFIKVQDGCSHFCSYCIVPYLRGKERSLSLKEAVDKVRRAATKFSEIVLCGVRLGCYGQDLSPPSSLVDLLKEILGKTEVKRVRLSSLEPNDLTAELLDLVATEERIASHFHLPLQSGDNRVLEEMNRPYTAEEFIEKTQEIKKKIPEVSLTTDILLGFPAENEEAFLNTIEVVKKAGFSRLHLFKFSPRPGTPAFSFRPRLPESVVHQRFLKMSSLERELRKKYASRFVGKVLRVLVERNKDGWCEGLSDNYLRVYFPASCQVGDLVWVKVEKEKEGAVFGKISEKKGE